MSDVDPGRGGMHEPRTYAAVLYGLSMGRRTGVLTVQRADEQRSLTLLAGRPVSFESNVREDGLEAAIEQSGWVPAKQLSWIKSKLGANESLDEALVGAGLVGPARIEAQRRELLHRGIGAALDWTDGRWIFEADDRLDPDRVDPALLPAFRLAAGLWRGVEERMTDAGVRAEVMDPEAGEVAIRPGLLEALDDFDLPSPLDELLGAVGVGAGAGAVVDALGDPRAVRLLWLFEVLGLIRRTGRGRDEDADRIAALARRGEPMAPKAAVPPSKKKKPPASSAESVTEPTPSDASSEPEPGRRRAAALRAAAFDPKRLTAAVKTDHELRMGATYYEFLGVSQDSPVPKVQAAANRLLRRWQAATRSPEIDPDVKAMAEELTRGGALAVRTLTDPSRRSEYDRRAARGQAPRLQGIRGAATEKLRGEGSGEAAEVQGEESARVSALIAKGDFDGAVPFLQRARRKSPSDPDVLADLGWCVHKAIGRAHDADEADEFLRLALTFDPNHPKALEYHARIAVETKDSSSRPRLRKLLAVQPNNRWARRALSESAEDSAATEKSGSRRFGFWK